MKRQILLIAVALSTMAVAANAQVKQTTVKAKTTATPNGQIKSTKHKVGKPNDALPNARQVKTAEQPKASK